MRELFDQYSGEVVYMQNPTDSERREFFKDLLLTQTTKLPSMKKQAGMLTYIVHCFIYVLVALNMMDGLNK